MINILEMPNEEMIIVLFVCPLHNQYNKTRYVKQMLVYVSANGKKKEHMAQGLVKTWPEALFYKSKSDSVPSMPHLPQSTIRSTAAWSSCGAPFFILFAASRCNLCGFMIPKRQHAVQTRPYSLTRSQLCRPILKTHSYVAIAKN